MATQIIGTQSLFAIEYVNESKGNSKLLAVRIWISGLPFGTLDDETYLPSFRHQLERFVHPEIHLVGDEETEDDSSLVSLGDTFDDFLIRRFGKGDGLFITVKLVDFPFFSYPLLSRGMLYKAIVPLQFAQQIVSEFNRLEL